MSALGDFLRNRRGRIGPADVGLPAGNGRRQTPGLRREELAALAGVSIDYYIRLEQGRDTNPGAGVLDALAGALRLDADERAHLRSLVARGRQPPAAKEARPGLVRLLEMVRPTPAYILNPTSDILAANPEGLRLLPGLEACSPPERNIVRYMFTDPRARSAYAEAGWQAMAEDCVAHLRTVGAAADALVAELSDKSPEFAALWEHYDVRTKSGSRRVFQHPDVGRFELTSEILTAVDGQRFVTFQAIPGTPDHDAVRLLGMAPGFVSRRPVG